MKDLFRTRQFWRTVAFMVGASLLIVILTVLSLRLFTRHGQSFAVPDFTGLSLEQLKPIENDYGFEFIVIDSVFDENAIPGTILKHDPAPQATVKRGRKFYVTLAASMPDMISMPNLIDLSLRQAISLLQSVGLSLGTVTYQPDFSENAVIDQVYHGQSILSGERVRRGAAINLIVSGTPEAEEPLNEEVPPVEP